MISLAGIRSNSRFHIADLRSGNSAALICGPYRGNLLSLRPHKPYGKGGMKMNSVSDAATAIVSCGTLSLELKYLKEEGFLDTAHLFFTKPGLHEDIRELDRQLNKQINEAKEKDGTKAWQMRTFRAIQKVQLFPLNHAKLSPSPIQLLPWITLEFLKIL
jgi:hypothetical protein